jgi:hypothetical protein
MGTEVGDVGGGDTLDIPVGEPNTVESGNPPDPNSSPIEVQKSDESGNSTLAYKPLSETPSGENWGNAFSDPAAAANFDFNILTANTPTSGGTAPEVSPTNDDFYKAITAAMPSGSTDPSSIGVLDLGAGNSKPAINSPSETSSPPDSGNLFLDPLAAANLNFNISSANPPTSGGTAPEVSPTNDNFNRVAYDAINAAMTSSSTVQPREASTPELEAAIANGARPEDLVRKNNDGTTNNGDLARVIQNAQKQGADPSYYKDLGLDTAQVTALGKLPTSEPTNAQLGPQGVAAKDFYANAKGEVGNLANAVDADTRGIIAPGSIPGARNADGIITANGDPKVGPYDVAGAGPNPQVVRPPSLGKPWEDFVIYDNNLNRREATAARLRDIPFGNPERGALDGVRGYERVRGSIAPVYNPPNAAGTGVDRDVYIVSLNKNTTLGIARNPVAAPSPTNPNPEATNRITATRAEEFARTAGANAPIALINGGFFDSYSGQSHADGTTYQRGNVLTTGQVGPGRKVEISTKNDGTGFNANADTTLNRGLLSPTGDNFQQDYNEAKDAATRGGTGFTVLHPSVADARHAAEQQRQVVYGKDEWGQLHVLVSKSNISQTRAVELMRNVVGSKGIIGVGDGGGSAQLSVLSGTLDANGNPQYINLVDSSRPVNHNIVVYK